MSTAIYGAVVLGTALLVWTAGAWGVLAKAGRPGWPALVPVYGAAKLLEVAGLPAWFVVVYAVPGANVAVHVLASVRLAQAFGQRLAFGLGLAVAPPVFLGFLGLGPAAHVPWSPPERARPAEGGP